MAQPFRRIPPPPQTQSRASKTFAIPTLDGSLTLQGIYHWHLHHSPQHRIFVFARADGSVRTIYWAEAVGAIYRAARLFDAIMTPGNGQRPPVVAIVANGCSDSISYFVTMMGLMFANIVFFPISTRNSAHAIAHLINEVGVSHVFVGHDTALDDLLKQATELLQTQYTSTNAPTTLAMPTFEELFKDDWEAYLDREGELPRAPMNPDAPALYLHSSGSTAFPTPIPWTQRRLIELCMIPWYSGQDMCDMVLSLHVMPMYHGMGVLQISWTACAGLVLGVFEPRSPAIFPTPENLFEAAKLTETDVVFCVPSFIEAWSKREECVNWLSSRVGGAMYGGGPLNKEVGDYLTSKGVRICTLYGSSECGIMNPMLPDPKQVGRDWEYFKFIGCISPHMEPYGNGLFELVMLESDSCSPSIINTQICGTRAFRTSDLFMQHPTKPDFWRVFGRSDDQIVHSTGEKTNPSPLENILNQDAYVSASVMFGRGKFQAGVVIEPKEPYRFDPSDRSEVERFRNLVWPTVERMNGFAPQHSRIFKEMILVAHPNKPFLYTAKNTTRRKPILKEYEQEIEDLYNAVEESTQPGLLPPTQWDPDSTKGFVRTVIHNVLSHPIDDSDDLFQHGCDSLSATWIRNSLLRALRDTFEFDGRQTTANFVYTHPTINGLSDLVCALAQGAQSSDEPGTSEEDMLRMLNKYKKLLSVEPITVEPKGTQRKRVLITGTTGSLGCHLLATLLADPDVEAVAAVNRPGAVATEMRQRNAFLNHGLDAGLLQSPKLSLFVMNLSRGVSLPNEVIKSLTHIIHNAWRVDFNLALVSFEPNILEATYLLNVARENRIRFIFTSSVGVFATARPDDRLLESPVDVRTASATGYSASKWIVEELIRALPEVGGIVLRIGQLAGGRTGAWHTREWFPTLVQSSKELGCLPTSNKEISWIAVSDGATIIADNLDIPAATYHIVHPRPVPWSSLSKTISEELGVKLVPYTEWLDLMLGSREETVASRKLLTFFEENAQVLDYDNRDAFGMPHIVLSSSLKVRDIHPLNEDDVRRWMAYWRRVGICEKQ
ncbi:acetyl-CoA synthetase-like protein [Mucidula mucida]|nr:acetyl-CoA synthetase-like protein [Mucidula mucida]